MMSMTGGLDLCFPPGTKISESACAVVLVYVFIDYKCGFCWGLNWFVILWDAYIVIWYMVLCLYFCRMSSVY